MIKITDKCKHCNRTCSNHVQNVKNHNGNVCHSCQKAINKMGTPVDLYVNGFFHRTIYCKRFDFPIRETIYTGSIEFEVIIFETKELWENETSEIRVIGEVWGKNIIKDRKTGILKRPNANIPSYIKNSPMVDEEIINRFEILDL